MGSRLARERRGLSLAIGILVIESAAWAGPGFGGLGGMRKKTLELNVRQPAVVRLANTSIAFKNAFTNPEYAPVVQSLAVALGTELVSNEKTLIEKDRPQDATWILQLTVTGYSVAQPTQLTSTAGGTTTTSIQWSGSLNAAYQVLDHAGRVYDAANVPCTYNEQFPVGTTSKNKFSLPGFGQKHKNDTGTVPNSTEDVKQILIHNVVGQIAAKLGNTTTSVEVQVATGDSHLDRAAEFLENKLWARALDELEKTPPFEKRDQEAYRQYDLGVAYEAISYTSASADDAKENIFKAAEYYDKAVEMNTKEKYFVATVARTRDALARYKEIEAQNRVPSKSAHPDATPDPDARARATVPSAVAETTAKPEQAGKMLTVADVIEMYTNKVPQDQIIDVIQGSTVDFNPRDKDTAIAIAKAGLPVRLQNALRAKVGAPPLKAPAPKTVPTKT